jgi:NOL1/NOP2/fmu family ribosome biogenesis protein
MENLRILNKKDIKRILIKLKEQFKAEIDLDYVFLKNNDYKIFLISKDVAKIDLSELRVDRVGLYFCKIEKNGIRLSIEGSQLIGDKAKKNVIKLNKDQMKEWLAGENISIKGNFDEFVIIKYEDDFFGSGRYSNNTIYNYVPKSRRLKVV